MACSVPLVAGHQGSNCPADGRRRVWAEFASVVDAVQCAVELQRRNGGSERGRSGAGRSLVLRIGATRGTSSSMGFDIQGDGVNVAARLEAMAEPGGICISASVFEQVG